MVQWFLETTRVQEVVGSNPSAMEIFSHLFVVKIVLFVLNRPNINQKETGIGPLKSSHISFYGNIHVFMKIAQNVTRYLCYFYKVAFTPRRITKGKMVIQVCTEKNILNYPNRKVYLVQITPHNMPCMNAASENCSKIPLKMSKSGHTDRKS